MSVKTVSVKELKKGQHVRVFTVVEGTVVAVNGGGVLSISVSEDEVPRYVSTRPGVGFKQTIEIASPTVKPGSLWRADGIRWFARLYEDAGVSAPCFGCRMYPESFASQYPLYLSEGVFFARYPDATLILDGD